MVRVAGLFCVCALGVGTAAVGQAPAPNGMTTGPRTAGVERQVRSPEVGPDRRVTFRLRAPQATEVTVSGEFQSGSVAMTKDSAGVWSVTVGPLKPEIYNYNFTIDGVKTIDPGNPEVKTGSTPGTIASILEVKGDGPAFYDAEPVPHGEMHTLWYQSKSLGTIRRVVIYTPPDYAYASHLYPVLYLFHGANADETAWMRLGHVNLILDNLLAEGKIKPFIVVMPFGYPAPPWPEGGGGGRRPARHPWDPGSQLTRMHSTPRVDRRQRPLGRSLRDAGPDSSGQSRTRPASRPLEHRSHVPPRAAQ